MIEVWLPTKTLVPFQASQDLAEAKSKAFQEAEAWQQIRYVVLQDGLYIISSHADLIHFVKPDIQATFARSW